MPEDFLEDAIVGLFGENGTDIATTAEMHFRLLNFEEWMKVNLEEFEIQNKLNELAKERKCYYIGIFNSKGLIGIGIPVIIGNEFQMYYIAKDSKENIGFYASLLSNIILVEGFGYKLAENKSVAVKPLNKIK